MKINRAFIFFITILESFVSDLFAQQQTKLSEYLISSTVKVESVGQYANDGKITAFSTVGTAFFFSFFINSDTIPVLVTNAHVIRNTLLNKLTFTKADSLFKPLRGDWMEYDNFDFENRWILHEELDLAILPLAPIMLKIKKSFGYRIDYKPFDESLIPADSSISQLSAIESLLMIGYPRGYWDSKNNYPIVRRGTTATPVYANFDDKMEFLLDIPIYSGSSGSPVLLFDDGMYSFNGSVYLKSRLYFLGIACKSIDAMNNDESILINKNTPLNIAVVIKSSALKDFKPILTKLLLRQHSR